MDNPSSPDHQLREPEQSLGDLVNRLTTELGDLMTAHVDLAKAELRQEAVQAGKGAGMLGAGGVAALVAAVMLSAAAAWALAETMAPGWAFLIVGMVWAAAAGALAAVGRNRLADVNPKPEQTMTELKEDKRWLKNQAN